MAVLEYILIFINNVYLITKLILFIIGLYSIYFEIKNSTDCYWFTSRLSILFESSVCIHRIRLNDNIYTLDIIIDLYYYIFIKNNIIIISALILLMFIFKWFILVFVLHFIYNNCKLVLYISFCYAFNKNTNIQFKMPNFTPYDSIYSLCCNNIKYLQVWSFLTIYSLISIKNKKFNLQLFEKFVTLYLFGLPIWYIRIILNIVDWLYGLYNSNIWQRKHIKVWPIIFINRIRFKLFENLRINMFKNFFNISELKIIILNHKIYTNPTNLEKVVKYIFNNIEVLSGNSFTNMNTVHFYGRSHQFFSTNDIYEKWFLGFTMTSGKNIYFKKIDKIKNTLQDAERIETTKISPYYQFQYCFLSFVNDSDIRPGVSRGFWEAMDFFDYRKYAGFVLRLKIVYELDFSQRIYFQGNDSQLIYDYKNLNPVHTRWLYKKFMQYDKKLTNDIIKDLNNNYSKNNISIDDLAKRESILNELTNVSNEDLYQTIKNKFGDDLNFLTLDNHLKQTHNLAMRQDEYA